MANGDRRLSDGRVVIQVSLGDAYHVSGGPFCCFLRVAPIASNWSDADERVTIDFISCNVYGLVTFHDRVADLSHIQGTYQFGFLKDVRAGLKPNESCHLLFTSDAVIFSTSTEIGPSTPECYYRYMCTIPPFLPPTVNSDYISCNYYVYVNVQYSNGIGSSQRSTLQCRLEFSIQGSVYSDVPTLNNEAYPFLPKSEGYILEGGRIDDRLLPKLYAEVKNGNLGNGSMLFDYDTLIDYLDPSLGDSTLVAKSSPNRYLLFRDLNAYWHVWDTMHGSNFVHEPEESYILRRYNGFVDEFTKMILSGPSKERLEQLRPWFGDMLSPWYTEDGEPLDEDARAKLLEQFYKDLEERHTKFYGISLDNLRRAASESVEVKRENPLQDVCKTLNFSLSGRQFCSCKLKGFFQRVGNDDFLLPTNSWFTLSFTFVDPFLCLHMEIYLVRIDTIPGGENRVTETIVLSRSLPTFGKSQTGVTMFAPVDTVPSFISCYVNVSYRLKLCFYHFPESMRSSYIEGSGLDLQQLAMLQWDYPVRLLQSESLRVQARCFVRNEPVTMEQVLHLAQSASSRGTAWGVGNGSRPLSTSINIH